MKNFLAQHARQPKIYIDLPSKGFFYNSLTIQDNQHTQIPIFGMNTMDEIMLKTPDALFTGESTVNVIKSCAPTILNPWNLLSVDIEQVLIAIRMATYGDRMAMESTCPKCKNSYTFDIDLNNMLSDFSDLEIVTKIQYKDLYLILRPLTYQESTNVSKRNYAIQKNIATAENNEEVLSNLYKDLNSLTLDINLMHIVEITDGQDAENNHAVIKEFIHTADSELYDLVKNGLSNLTKKWSLPLLSLKCANQDCKHDYNSKLDLDYSSFFERGSSH